MTIIARIYDTDGSQDWVGLPTPRTGETLDDYAFRLQRWVRREIVSCGAYGEVDRVVDVDGPHEAHVVVRVETDEEFVEYYLLADDAGVDEEEDEPC
jgi:hypothetical protein